MSPTPLTMSPIRLDWAGGQANGSPIGMGWADGCVNANVANPVDDVANALPVGMDWAEGWVDANSVDDVANASPIGMDWADGYVDVNVTNPVDDVADVADASSIGMDWAGGCVDANVANPVDDVANASPIAMDCAGGCIQDWLVFSHPKPIFTVQNGINWDKPVFKCVANRNGLCWWLHPGLVGIFPPQTCFYRPKNGINWDKPVFPVFNFQNWEKLSKTRKKSGTNLKWVNGVVHGSMEGKVICAHFCSEWSIVGYGTSAFWDLWIKSIIRYTFEQFEHLHNGISYSEYG